MTNSFSDHLLVKERLQKCLSFLKVFENRRKLNCLNLRQNKKRFRNFREFTKFPYIFSTAFKQKLWKSFLALFLLFLLSSCASLKKENPKVSEALRGLTEQEIIQRLGKPDTVAKTKEGTIYFIYIPKYRIFFAPKGELYLEFEEGKVKRVIEK